MTKITLYIRDQRKRKIAIAGILAVVVVFCIGAGYLLAYLVKPTQSRVNNMTVGDIAIALTEKEWDKLSSEDRLLYPGKTLPKDPQITNVGKNGNEVYAFFQISVPTAPVRTVDEGEVLSAKEKTELFSFSASNGWVLIGTPQPSADGRYMDYVYGYETPVADNETTPALFSQVSFAPILEGELSAGTGLEILVNAMAVQKDYINPVGNLPAEWLKDIYDRLLKADA